ncbi:MAG: TIM-barrel domain-containing protein, partial [bacterium]
VAMSLLTKNKNKLLYNSEYEKLLIEPWGKDSLRVRASKNFKIKDKLPGALLEPVDSNPEIIIKEEYATITNGKITAKIDSKGILSFFRRGEDKPFLSECQGDGLKKNRRYKSLSGEHYKVEVLFEAPEDERIYGLGQHQNSYLDQKGCSIDLVQNNGEVAIPFMVSSYKYGFLWNNPAIGRVELARNCSRWTAEETKQIDYFVTCGETYTDIMERYAEATGFPGMLPSWAAGFWQSKLRYSSQEELMEVAKEYKDRDLPLSVIVIDYFHWTKMGDWKFDEKDWPDPSEMVKTLEEMGIKVLLSVWPTVNRNSENFEEMNKRGLLLRNKRGVNATTCFIDAYLDDEIYLHLYDPSNPEARKYVWKKIKENYYDKGIKVWWLDACEPEISTIDHDNLLYSQGSGQEIGCIYPLYHQQTFFDGMQSEGEEDIVLLSRSAWAGSQRYGTAVWSGDIATTFESLREQLRAGLNISMSGIPWWTTDIGGFVGGDPDSDDYRELIIRWFQYGVFCPLFRLHGYREPMIANKSGGPNEVWSYGDEAYQIFKELLFLREKMKPYILRHMKLAHQKGTPVMRPLFFDFQCDEKACQIDDQYMFGSDLMVAPVLYRGAESRKVYFPEGTKWIDLFTGENFRGGVERDVTAALDKVPVYYKEGYKPFS